MTKRNSISSSLLLAGPDEPIGVPAEPVFTLSALTADRGLTADGANALVHDRRATNVIIESFIFIDYCLMITAIVGRVLQVS